MAWTGWSPVVDVARDEGRGCRGGILGAPMEMCAVIEAGVREEVRRWRELAQEGARLVVMLTKVNNFLRSSGSTSPKS